MILEMGTNLYHTAVLLVIVWGIARFFTVLGKVAEQAERKSRVRKNEERIRFTK